jgi:DNA-binding beta-propeller fold protein YncE
MKRFYSVLLFILTLSTPYLSGVDQPPLRLLHRIKMPGIKKSFDHLTPDVKGGRLFVAAEWNGSVEVYDINTGRLIHSIGGMGRPHAILYRDDLNRIFVTDGTDDGGAVCVYDGKTYKLIKKIELLPDTDSIGYDQATKFLYVTNGGEDAKLEYSLLSIIDTTSGEKIDDIKIESDTIGGMQLEDSSKVIYLDEPDKKSAKKTIGVIDRDKRQTVAGWRISASKREGALALDRKNHRLFVGVIEGTVVVLDTDSGKEVTSFPIGKGLDDLVYDPKSQRIYAACDDGAIHVYKQAGPDDYKLLGKVASGQGARTGRLVPEIGRYFTAVPAHGTVPAELLIYKVQ